MKKFKDRKKNNNEEEVVKGEVDLLGQLEKGQLIKWLESSKDMASGDVEFAYVLCKIIGDITSESLYKNEKIGWKKKYVVFNDDSYRDLEAVDEELVYEQVIKRVGEDRLIVTIPNIKANVKFADTIIQICLKNPYDSEDLVDVLRLSAFRIAQFFIQAESISEDASIEEDLEVRDPLDVLMSYLKGPVATELREKIDHFNKVFITEERERKRELKIKRERERERNFNRTRSQSKTKNISRG